MYEEDSTDAWTLRERTLYTPFLNAPALERWRSWMLRGVLTSGARPATARAVLALARLDPNSRLVDTVLADAEKRRYLFSTRRSINDIYARAAYVMGYTYAALRELERYGLAGISAAYLKERVEVEDPLTYLSAMAQVLVLASAFRQGLDHPVLGTATREATRGAPTTPRTPTTTQVGVRLGSEAHMTPDSVYIENAGPGMARAIVAGATSLWPLGDSELAATFEDIIAGNDADPDGSNPVGYLAALPDTANFGYGVDLDGTNWLQPGDGADPSAGLWASTYVVADAFPATLLLFQYGSGDTLALQTDGIGTLQLELFSAAEGYPLTLPSITLSTGTPYHIAFAYDPSSAELRLSVNGAGPAAASLSAYSEIDPSGNELIYFGRNPVSSLFNGRLGYVALAQGASLTQGELDVITA